jgi:hypothetical protein
MPYDQHRIVALREHFPADTPDVEWIKTLDHQGGWAVLTRDLHLRTRPHERAALDRARIVFFFLAGSWQKLGIEETTAHSAHSEDGGPSRTRRKRALRTADQCRLKNEATPEMTMARRGYREYA